MKDKRSYFDKKKKVNDWTHQAPCPFLKKKRYGTTASLVQVVLEFSVTSCGSILTQHFGLRGRQEHHSMNVEDFNLCRDDRGIEYVTFKENPTKTRQGGLNSKRRQVLPKMFAAGGPRCPVGLFKDFLSRRPPELRESGPFYLAIIERPKTEVWYKKQRLGIHSIDQMMKNIVKSTPIALSGKKLTNHSARKTLVKKLRTANVERQSIIQVTGHASEQSL